MSDVFISYSSENSDIAGRIAKDLTRLGLKVFYDKELIPGEAWASRLTQELKRAKYVLVLLSPSYIKSQWARRELEAAALAESEGRTRIVPIVVENTEIPPFLRTKYYADLREDYETGLARLQKALTTTPEPSEESRARRSRKVIGLLGVLASLISVAASAISVIGGSLIKVDSSVIAIVIIAVVGLTTLVAAISAYRPYRRSGPIEITARAVEQAYVDTLEESELNPLRVWEGKHG